MHTYIKTQIRCNQYHNHNHICMSMQSMQSMTLMKKLKNSSNSGNSNGSLFNHMQ